MTKSLDISERAGVLERLRNVKMASSTHAYVRGNTARFYTWLAESKSSERLPDGPSVWICGDCHVGNLGPVADADGRVDIQIRDLDQTVIGNPAHDLIRLGLSLATAARGSDLPGVTTAQMIEEMVVGYEMALAAEGAGQAPEPEVVRSTRRRALGRRWRHLARERIEDVDPVIPLGKRFWKLERHERDALDELFETEPVKQMILTLASRDADDRVSLVDAAYWRKGCSSLGFLRYAALVGIGGSKKTPARYALIDLKEAVPSVAPHDPRVLMPADHAERVVAGAQALSPHLGERMLAAHVLDKPVVLRELLPQDLKIELDQFSQHEATRAARYLAYVVGKAHARQMSEAAREAWHRTLNEHRGARIDAPSWLWRSVVELIGTHETGYLEHCRRYALSEAA